MEMSTDACKFNDASPRQRGVPGLIVLLRFIHGAIGVCLLACLVYIYYCALTNQHTVWTYVAGAALLLEGLLLLCNRGDCPLGHVHHRLGDDKAFFELFLPKKVAKQAVPFLTGMAVLGLLLLFL